MIKLIGALTSKPYAFKARPWELETIYTIDPYDSTGTNIKVSLRGSQILRILPRINNHINEEWISDKIRFSFDGLSQQRIFYPYLKINNLFKKIEWKQAFDIIKEKFYNGYYFEGICGNISDAESVLLFKKLLNKIGNSSIESRNSNIYLNSDLRTNYLMNTKLNDIDNTDLCLLVGTNPRLEAPALNLKLRKKVLKDDIKILSLGYNSNLTFDQISVGNTAKILINLIEGKHQICRNIVNAQTPSIYIGFNALSTVNSSLFQHIKPIFNKYNWNGYNIVHQNSTSVSGLELNCINNINEDRIHDKRLLYIYNCDEIIVNKNNCDFIIYQGHTADNTAKNADLILPGSTLFEKNGTLINNEGIKQSINFCVNPPGQSRNDWKIFEALGNYLDLDLSYKKLDNIKTYLNEICPNRSFNDINIKEYDNLTMIENSYFLTSIDNFYMTDVISRNSTTMALASNRFIKLSYNFIN